MKTSIQFMPLLTIMLVLGIVIADIIGWGWWCAYSKQKPLLSSGDDFYS